MVNPPAKRVHFWNFEEAVAVVANLLQLVEHLLLEVAAALELEEALLPAKTERTQDS